MGHGGKRPGAGKPKGHKSAKTLEKEAVLEGLRQLYLKRADRSWTAQMDHAEGIGYMVIRRADGTYVRADDEKQINAALQAGGELMKIYTQAPNVAAFSDLNNRVFGKPPERMEISGKDGEPLIVQLKGKPW